MFRFHFLLFFLGLALFPPSGGFAQPLVPEKAMVLDLSLLLTFFFLAAALVVGAGVVLTRAGDELGERLNLGGSWIGLVFISAVTSMPELVSSFGGAVFKNLPDMATGNVFGSNCFNIFIISLLDLYYRGGPVSYQFGVLPTFSAGLGIAMTAVGALAILASQKALFPDPPMPPYVWTAAILIAYFVSMYLIFRFERRTMLETEAGEEREAVDAAVVGESSWNPLVFRLFLASLVTVGAGYLLVVLADKLAVYPFRFGALGHSFVGTMGLALATSLPELVVGITAIRIGNFGIVVGNIFGSNIFNILILALCHIAYSVRYEASFYSESSLGAGTANLFTALLAIVLAGIAVAGLVYRGKRTFLGMGWEAGLILLVYSGGMYWLYLVGR